MAIPNTTGTGGVSSKYVYPEDFFNIEHPGNPMVNIQFKTKVSNGKSISDPTLWSDVVFNPNNFFDNINLEDSGGGIKMTLSLVDINHSFLEDKIIALTQTLNVELDKGRKEQRTSRVTDTISDKYVSVRSFTSVQSTIRIRFGYSVSGSNKYFQTSSLEEFKNRVSDSNKKTPVSQTPWLYFIVTGLEANLTEKGLEVAIEAIGETSPILDSLKLVNVGYQIRGTAEEIIEVLGEMLEGVLPEKKLEIIVTDNPIVALNENETEELYLSLGEMLETGEFEFKSISSILNDFCSMVHPVYYNVKNRTPVSQLTTYNDIEEAEEKSYISYGYGWRFVDGDKKKVLEFYYKKPDAEQNAIRTYTWFEHAQSVVKDVKLNSEFLFSQLSLPLFEKDGKGQHRLYSINMNEDGSTNTDNMTDLLDDESFRFTFVKNSYDDDVYKISSETEGSGITRIAHISANLNNIFSKGTITLLGDPFFLFDISMVPFGYIINLVIKKPTYIDENGERVGGGKSYLSGEYTISKITHSISSGEFSTSLEIQRAF